MLMLADCTEATCSLLLAILATKSGNANRWKLTHIIMVTCDLCVEICGHCSVKQTHDNVFRLCS